MVFFSVAIYLDCAWSANGGRKEKIRKSQVGNQLLKLYFGSFCSTDSLSITPPQSVFSYWEGGWWAWIKLWSPGCYTGTVTGSAGNIHFPQLDLFLKCWWAFWEGDLLCQYSFFPSPDKHLYLLTTNCICYGGNCVLEKRFPGVKNSFLSPFQKLNCKLIIQNGIFVSVYRSIHKRKFTLDSKTSTQLEKKT